MFFSSGCMYMESDLDININYLGNIAGFKTNYRPPEFPMSDYYLNFSKEVLRKLFSIQGFGYYDGLPPIDTLEGTPFEQEIIDLYFDVYGELPSENPSQYTQFYNENKVYYLDDVRYSIYQDEELFNAYKTSNNEWLWSFESSGEQRPYFVINTSSASATSVVEHYKTNALTYLSFYNNFIETYAPALQVAILEILLGREPTIFNEANVDEAVGMLPNLKTDYSKYASYVGIDWQQDLGVLWDGDEISEIDWEGEGEDETFNMSKYLLYSVIGEQKFDNVENHFDMEHYKVLIEYIWQEFKEENFPFYDETLGVALTECVFDVYPATILEDYPGLNFFISEIAGNQFDHIPNAEYQSMALMPILNTYVYEMWFYIVSNKVLNINVYYRAYNHLTNSFSQSEPQIITTVLESKFDETNASIAQISFKNPSGGESIYEMLPFNNLIDEGLLLAFPDEKLMNYEISQYYKVIPSISNEFGGVAVFDEEKFEEKGCSFFEIVFDVEKDPYNPQDDYTFKVGMFALWVASMQQIGNYLSGN